MFTCLTLEIHDTIELIYTTAKSSKKNLIIKISFDIFSNNMLQEKNRRRRKESQQRITEYEQMKLSLEVN